MDVIGLKRKQFTSILEEICLNRIGEILGKVMAVISFFHTQYYIRAFLRNISNEEFLKNSLVYTDTGMDLNILIHS